MVKIDPGVARANKASLSVLKKAAKDAGLNPADLASKFDVSADEVKEWFSSTMPYDVFLQLCKITHVKATDVFEQTKEKLRQKKEASMTSSWSEVKDKRAVASSDASASIDGTDGEIGINASSDSSAEDNEDKIDDAKPGPSAATATVTSAPKDSSVNLDGKPDDLPFPLLGATAADVGLKNADALILEWPDVKREAIDLRTDLSDDQKESKLKKYPKPSKLSNDKVELIFPSYKAAQGFVNGGYLNNVNEIAGRRHYGVTITVREKQSNS